MEDIIDAFIKAGYYRAVISTLSEFDKIIGGMAWAMQIFSYDLNIDVFYTDTLDLGQKISLTERLVMVLIAMKCPCRIEPHQIVGLDYASLTSCIRWLLKRSEEVRQEHEAFNRLLALRHYQRITKNNSCDRRAYWCHVVPSNFLNNLENYNDSQSKTAGNAELQRLLDDLNDGFKDNQRVSFVQLPSHFRAVNVTSICNTDSESLRYTRQINVEASSEDEDIDADKLEDGRVSLGAKEARHDSSPGLTSEERQIHKELDNELVATNQKILNLLRKIDSSPNELEINQYQRRFIELHQQLISKNKNVKKLFDLFNCLDSTKYYLSKEINLLDSIAANFNLTTNSVTNRNLFMQQFQDIVSKIEEVKKDAQERRDVLRRRCEHLNSEYANLVDSSISPASDSTKSRTR